METHYPKALRLINLFKSTGCLQWRLHKIWVQFSAVSDQTTEDSLVSVDPRGNPDAPQAWNKADHGGEHTDILTMNGSLYTDLDVVQPSMR